MVNNTTELGHAQIVVTDSNLNPIVQIITWLLLAAAILMLSFRLLSKHFLKASRVLGWENAFIFFAYLFAVGQSVLMIVPGSNIFGKEIDGISPAELRTGLKLSFASDLLFVLSLGMAKLSINTTIRSLTPIDNNRLITLLFGVVIALWTILSFLGIAFQCGTRGPWDSDSSHCINQHTFLEFVGVSNIFTDLALIAYPAAMIWPLQMPWSARATVIALFSSRALVIVATVCQLVYLPRLFEDDYTLRAFPYYLCVQFVQFASVSAACIVYFLPFLHSLQSGFMWADTKILPSAYSLSKLSRPALGGTNVNTDGNHYVEITTENFVISKPKSCESDHNLTSKSLN